MDLRLHKPRPDVVIVRVSGTVGRVTAPALTGLVGKQLARAPHVIIDLGDASVLSPGGLAVLRTLHQQAVARGRQLHIVGARSDAVRQSLRVIGLAHLITPDSTADTVIAGLPPPATGEITRQPPQGAGRTGCGRAPGTGRRR
ncbi:MAG: STAS domain-containing protein [Pseudonocardiaceae bacterium]